MYRPTPDVMRDPAKMASHLEALVVESVAQRRAGLVPALFSPQGRHIVYRREPPGVEEWQTALDTFRRGFGDCEDLAIWRCADLRIQGLTRAKVHIKEVRPGLKHAQVLAGGQLYDPSRVRGMRGRG
jgi:hypothetical protein